MADMFHGFGFAGPAGSGGTTVTFRLQVKCFHSLLRRRQVQVAVRNALEPEPEPEFLVFCVCQFVHDVHPQVNMIQWDTELLDQLLAMLREECLLLLMKFCSLLKEGFALSFASISFIVYGKGRTMGTFSSSSSSFG